MSKHDKNEDALADLMAALDKSLSVEDQLALTHKAACAFEPDSLEGEAAIDRLMDLGAQHTGRNRPGTYYLQQATLLSSPGSMLRVKGLRLIDQLLDSRCNSAVTIDTTTFLLWNFKDLPADKVTHYSNLWRDAVRDDFMYDNDAERTLRTVMDVVSDPRSGHELITAAIPLWKEMIAQIEVQLGDITAFSSTISTNAYLYKGEKPKTAAHEELKKIVAKQLLDFSQTVSVSGVGQIAVLAASRYDGSNLSLRSAIIKRLTDIIADPADKEYIEQATKEIEKHEKYIQETRNGFNPPLPPSPAP